MAPIPPSQTFSSIGNTNYVPLPHEAEELRTAIMIEKGYISVVDEEIEQLHRRLTVLESRKAVHAKVIEEYSALLSPVRALPPEILGKIFMACLDHYLGESPSSRWRKHHAYLLSQVCRSWREISVAYPRLWSIIDIWLPIHPLRVLHKRYRMPLESLPREEQDTWNQRVAKWEQRVHSIHEMLKLSLDRSSKLPLTISFGAKAMHPMPNDANGCIMYPIVDTLISGYGRLEDVTLKLKLEDPHCPLAKLLVGRGNEVPLLRKARLDVKLGGMAEQENSEVLLLNLKGPILTSMDLKMRWYFVRIMAEGIDWSVLTDLRLCTMGRDDILTPEVDSVMETLGKCPRLVRCALELEHEDYTTLPDHQAEGYPVSLPHLRELTIYGYGVHLFLSRALDLPSLEEICTLKTRHNPYNGAEEEMPDGILPWAQMYGSQLKHVSFEYGFLSQPQLLCTLSSLVDVVSLTMSGVVDYGRVGFEQDDDEDIPVRWMSPARLSDEVLQQLTPGIRDSTSLVPSPSRCFCPRLQRFDCTTGLLDFNERGLVEFITARRRVADKSESGIGQLKEVVLILSAPTTIDFRSELENRGVDIDAFDFKVRYASDE